MPEHPQPPATVTPGQAAYEASIGVIRGDLDGEPWRWDQLPQRHHDSWDAAAQAAIAAHSGTLPRPHELLAARRERDEARAVVAEITALLARHRAGLGKP